MKNLITSTYVSRKNLDQTGLLVSSSSLIGGRSKLRKVGFLQDAHVERLLS